MFLLFANRLFHISLFSLNVAAAQIINMKIIKIVTKFDHLKLHKEANKSHRHLKETGRFCNETGPHLGLQRALAYFITVFSMCAFPRR